MDSPSENNGSKPVPLYSKQDIVTVMKEISIHMQTCTRAWIGLGQGRVLILKDDVKGLSTYYAYEEGYFTFYDHRGGKQTIHIEQITEIAGY
jgi:hypothetical protein